MRTFVTWFIDNSIAANLLMYLIIIAGILSMSSLTQEIFPDLESEFVSVNVSYPGATPREIEESIVTRIEERIQGVEGIKEVSSRSFEGVGVVNIEALTSYPLRILLDDIKAEVDSIDSFPEQSEKPIVQELDPPKQVLNLALFGNYKEESLKQLAQKLRDQLVLLSGVSKVEISNERPFEIAIEVHEQQLRELQMSFAELTSAVQASSRDVPGGSIKKSDSHILLRTIGKADTVNKFENIVIKRFSDGQVVKLKDVATVRDGFAESDRKNRFNGKPAVILDVFRVGKEDANAIKRAVDQYIAKVKDDLPAGVSLVLWQDYTRLLRGRMDLLIKNGLIGITLVFLVLSLFLEVSLAFWITLGIPISFLGTFMVMPYLGVSINMLSLFGFILVLGIVVDDAIIVGESIYAEMERGRSPYEAAIVGTQRVATSVVFSILTSVAAFLALISVPGNMGKIFAVISWVVIASLLFSLLESLSILPVHLAHDVIKPFFRLFSGIGKKLYKFKQAFAQGFLRFRRECYEPLLNYSLQKRYLTLAIALAIWIVSIGLVMGGRIEFSFFPDVEGDIVSVGLRMPNGTSAEKTSEVLHRLEKAAFLTKAHIEQEAEEAVVTNLLTALGGQPYRGRQGARGGAVQDFIGEPHLGEITLELVPSEERNITAKQVEQLWKAKTGKILEAEEVSFTSALFSSGSAVSIQIAGEDFEVLRQAAKYLKSELGKFTGVYNLSDTFSAGKKELRILINKEGRALGLNSGQIGREVRHAFFGSEALRIQRGKDELKVMLRFPLKDRRVQSSLENIRISLPNGTKVPLSTVADLSYADGFSEIKHVDRWRTINVTAEVNESETNSQVLNNKIKTDIFSSMKEKYPDLRLTMAGQQRDLQDTVGGLKTGFTIALIVIYALMAIPFKSYVQPLIIMAAIPFGIIGALIGHLVIGIQVTILSLFGLVALSGVVVNDGLVLVSFLNRLRADGKSLDEATLEACQARFRAVIITSVTTFFGLVPMIFETSTQAQFLVPVAVSLGFGVMFATFITLLLVPVGYLIVEDLSSWFGGKLFAIVRKIEGKV